MGSLWARHGQVGGGTLDKVWLIVTKPALSRCLGSSHMMIAGGVKVNINMLHTTPAPTSD